MNAKKAAMPLKAVTFASQMHDGQMRKDDLTPYIAHPVRVMTILSEVFGVEDEEVLAAGVLHDTVEDTEAERSDIEELFGENVAEYVEILSKDENLDKKERELQYAKDLAVAPVKVRLCKLADIYDNLSDTKALSKEKIKKTVARAERLFNLMTDDFPPKWENVVRIMEEKIERVKTRLNEPG